jgi:YbbR domain-containing protein
LLLAILVWIAAIREQNPPREDNYDRNIPLEVVAPASGLVNTTTLPETVKLRLLAPESSWQALTPSKFRAQIDLSRFEAGLHDAPVMVEISDRQIEIVEQIPNEVTVNLEQVQTITLPVQIDVLDTAPLGYSNKAPTADPPQVDVTGPASLVSQAHKAVTQILIRNSKETIESLQEVVIRNREDQIVKGLALQPPKVLITLPIEQRFGYKDVSVKVVVEGQVAPGYRVSNISVDPPTLTVVGKPAGLNQITGLVETAPINLNQATQSIVRVVPLNLPDGVAAVSSSNQQSGGPDGVEVKVEITPIEDGINLQRPITQQGIDPNYWWRAAPNQADVFLSGPLPRLQSLRASDIEVIVDLFGLEPGTHKLQPSVFHPEGLSVDAILPDAIEITIGRLVERPVVQQGLGPNYTWTPIPGRVKAQLTGSAEQLRQLRATDVRVVVDLTDLVPGFYRLTPLVLLPTGVKLDTITPETIDVSIRLQVTPIGTRTITATATITGAPTLPTQTTTPEATKSR